MSPCNLDAIQKSRNLISRITASVLAFSFFVCAPSSASITKLSPEAKEYLLKEDGFTGISRVEDIPGDVLQKFAEIAKDPNLQIADPGKKFQETDFILEEGLPLRRLIWGGISNNYCVIHYERGGRGHSYYVILFKRSGKAASFLWGGTRFESIRDLPELRELIRADGLDDSLPYSW